MPPDRFSLLAAPSPMPASPSASNDASAQDPKPRARGDFRGLIAILIGILLGVLVGVFFGRAMWLASGGPSQRLARLQLALEQKQEFADREERLAQEAQGAVAERHRQEAERLRRHIPIVEQEIERVAELARQVEADRAAGRYQAAAIAWEVVDFVGGLFLQVLKLLVIPLVVTSMLSGITALGDVRQLGRIGGLTIAFYITSMAIAVTIGILLVQWIEPGKNADNPFAYVSQTVESKRDITVLGTILNVFRGDGGPGSGMFPSNIFQAAAETNVLALIAFSLVFGGVLTTLGPKAQVVIDFFNVVNDAVMKMVHLVMLFAPIGIFGLVAANIARQGGGDAILDELRRIGSYVATVLTGLGLQFGVLMAALWILARRNPFIYTFNLLKALLTAMSTASSSATLPVTMECVEENNKVSPETSSFVLPLGATVNMDGTALYEAVAVIFIAQSQGIELGVGQLFAVFLTSTLAAVGAAGIPEAGLVTMVIVLQAAGVPLEGIGTILAVDWFLDRMRTTVNVFGDAIGAGVIDRVAPHGARAKAA
jgi:Na+/H+-dicarboxylate symporter